MQYAIEFALHKLTTQESLRQHETETAIIIFINIVYTLTKVQKVQHTLKQDYTPPVQLTMAGQPRAWEYG